MKTLTGMPEMIRWAELPIWVRYAIQYVTPDWHRFGDFKWAYYREYGDDVFYEVFVGNVTFHARRSDAERFFNRNK